MHNVELFFHITHPVKNPQQPYNLLKERLVEWMRTMITSKTNESSRAVKNLVPDEAEFERVARLSEIQLKALASELNHTEEFRTASLKITFFRHLSGDVFKVTPRPRYDMTHVHP